MRRGIKSWMSEVTDTERWVAKLVASLLATAALWVRIKTSLKTTKWSDDISKEWSTHSSPAQKIYKE